VLGLALGEVLGPVLGTLLSEPLVSGHWAAGGRASCCTQLLSRTVELVRATVLFVGVATGLGLIPSSLGVAATAFAFFVERSSGISTKSDGKLAGSNAVPQMAVVGADKCA
jgi:hypothetical protein